MRGGPRPNAGRKPYADPTTAEEAARMLSAYVEGAYPTPAGNVGIPLAAAVALLHKLRRRRPGTTSAARKVTP